MRTTLIIALGGLGCTDPAPDATAVRQELLASGIVARPAAPDVSPELYELGQMLAFDPVLSGNGDIACLTCHHPMLGTDDDRSLPAGTGAEGLGADRTGEPVIPRNAPPLFDLHLYETMFWDSRVGRLEDGTFANPAGDRLPDVFDDEGWYGLVAVQAMFPVTSRHEMRGEVGENPIADRADDDFVGMWDELWRRLGDYPGYRPLFEAAYPDTPFVDQTFAHAANAIAGFEIAAYGMLQTPLDRFLAGDDDALTAEERRGALAFVDGGCAECHTGPALSDFDVHDTALPHLGPGRGNGPEGDQDYGRAGIDAEGAAFAFRTAPLRQVAWTAPYGHAGQFATLEAFVGHYAEPRTALFDYDPEVELADPALVDSHDPDAAEAIWAARDPALEGLVVDIDALVHFLGAVSSRALDLDATVPVDVPSGMPVDHPNRR